MILARVVLFGHMKQHCELIPGLFTKYVNSCKYLVLQRLTVIVYIVLSVRPPVPNWSVRLIIIKTGIHIILVQSKSIPGNSIRISHSTTTDFLVRHAMLIQINNRSRDCNKGKYVAWQNLT